MVQGPYTNIDYTYNYMNTLPSDSTPDRLAVEVHYYDPWQFTGQTGSGADYFWGEAFHSSTMPNRNVTWGEEDWMLGQLQKMHDKFVSEGIPVLLGEFGAMDRTGTAGLTGADLELHLSSRLYYHQLFADMANSLGIVPYYWDNGYTGGGGNGIFDRDTATVFDQDMVDALTGVLAPTGDYNGDGVVDAADYTVWRDTLGQGVAIYGDGADGDLSGTIDEGDFIFWKQHFGETVGSGALLTTVPEPASWLLAALALIGLTALGRARRD